MAMPRLETREPGPGDILSAAFSQDLESKEFTCHLPTPLSTPPWQKPAPPPTSVLLSKPLVAQGRERRVGRREERTVLAFSITSSPNGPEKKVPPERDCAPGPEVPLRRGLTWPVVPVAAFWPQCSLWLGCSSAGWVSPPLSVEVLAWSSGGQIPPRG